MTKTKLVAIGFLLIFFSKRKCDGTEQNNKRDGSYKVKVSFQVGLRQHLMVLVFCLLSLLGSGISLSLT